ncbi:MAG: type II secretion system protein N [Legionellaceae bacterium]|nr:type II secretion system protein N [Legionellaceae bacterium]
MLSNADLKAVIFRPVVAQGLCVIFILLFIWQTMTSSLAYLKITQNHNMHVEPAVIEKNKNQPQLDTMLSLPLFGEYIPKQFGDMNIKKSNLNLRVVGILFSSHQQNSQVIIRTANGMEQTFKIGDTIPGGAIIKRISADGVLVAHDGELESLSLPKEELIFDAPPKELKQLK